uniref:Uncharacterized protein n=1 Tax=Oryza sativa subsp. japonica TaxID=39947 RepID=Q8H392_ORYSJ|nr:hypothetical protein [Oryza sativa Japonica Group]BAC83209.1 hypothetical protein [Oryza sativa Japonica Group]
MGELLDKMSKMRDMRIWLFGERGREKDKPTQINTLSQNRHQYMPPDTDIRDKPRQIQSGAIRGQQEGSSAISDLAEYIFEEEDYPVVN